MNTRNSLVAFGILALAIILLGLFSYLYGSEEGGVPEQPTEETTSAPADPEETTTYEPVAPAPIEPGKREYTELPYTR